MNVEELQGYLKKQFGQSAPKEHAGAPASGVKPEQGQDTRGSVADQLLEVEMASRMGYLLCQCTWPPQIMVLCNDQHVFRCPQCSRMRDF